ncbi:MAG: AMP-binding protein [Betaproteobacteria bacterium]|nr:AMP-binding protein [Betaproteobacteria bacterium]
MSNTLSAFLDAMAACQPTAPAFIDRERPVSFGQISDESRRLATGLKKLGVEPGDRVALWLPNIPAWVASLFACARLGAIAVAVNTRFKSGEIADIVGRSGARALIFWPGFKQIDFSGILEAADPAALERVENYIVYREDESPLPGHLRGRPVYDYQKIAGSLPLQQDRATADSGCVIFTTSGTTKAPKFVLHRHAAILQHARDVATGFGFSAPDTVVLPSVPFCGVAGFCQVMATLSAGRPLVTTPAFDAAESAALIRRYGVTHTVALGDMAASLLASASGEGHPFPSLRMCGFAVFSPNQAAIVAEAEAKGVPLLGLYGSSEVQALFARQPFSLPAQERIQGGGHPFSSEAVVRVRDPDSGRLLPPRASGELELRGPSRMLEYYGNPEATAEALTADGFFRSGDLGFLTEDGRFVYQNRMGDVLRLAGFLVSPVEIEGFLKEHPTVADAQVVGVEINGAPRAAAFVIPAAEAAFDEAALIAFCRRRMANYKVPGRIFPIDDFPVTPSANGNKIQKTKLRQMAQERVGQ